MPDALDMKLLRGLSAKERVSRLIILGMVLGTLVLAGICLAQALKWIGQPFPGFLVNQRMVQPGVSQFHWTGTQGV